MSNTRHTTGKPDVNVAAAEAKGEGIPVEYDGHTYTIPPSSKWDIDAIEAAELGQVVRSTKMILGAEQWAEFRKTHRTLGDLEKFMEAVSELTGGNL